VVSGASEEDWLMADGAHGNEPSDPHSGSPRTAEQTPNWWLFRGTGQPLALTERDRRWPKPPPWRTFPGGPDLPAPQADEAEARRRLGTESIAHSPDPNTVTMVNSGIYLSRPLIVTGKPGSGKSALAHIIARELGLGRVLQWSITSSSTLRNGLYEYDSFGRAQAIGADEDSRIGNFVHLGPLGTALLPHRLPRVLLIDELDKSNIDLPNDLLSVFEEGQFSIKELVRVRDREPEVNVHTADSGTAPVRDGVIRCHAFPIIVITSNGEREFPAALMRRCLTVNVPDPDVQRLATMVAAHFPDADASVNDLVRQFVDDRASKHSLAVDQLLNAVHLATSGVHDPQHDESWSELLDAIWHRLSAGPV
jgi:MoxR-like ATPase